MVCLSQHCVENNLEALSGAHHIHKEGPHRFFFNSQEESRMHVHVSTSEGTAKFWLEPIVALAATILADLPPLTDPCTVAVTAAS